MRREVNTVRAAMLGAALACALPTAGSTDPGLKFEGRPWIPALAIVSSPPDESAADSSESGPDVSMHTPLLALVLGPEELGESGVVLERTLSAAESGSVAVPARVSIGPAPGEADATEEQWAPAVLVIARADADPPQPPAPERPGQELEEHAARRRDETARWVPAFGLDNGILGQGTNASVESHFLPFGQEMRPSDSGSATLLYPWVGASLELMTPGWGDAPGRPRFFLHGGAAYNFGFDRDVAKEGSPGEFEPPVFEGANKPEVEDAGVVKGQGSTTRVEPQPLIVTGGAGVAFSLDAFGRRIRIKPSVEYLREELEIVGTLKDATVQDPGGGTEDATYDYITLSGRQRETYHGVGPGIEIETDAGRVGPIVLTLFVSGQAYRILGNRTTEIQNEPSSPCTVSSPDFVRDWNPELDRLVGRGCPAAKWSFTKDAWSYRGGVGMRFRWLPD